MGRVPAASSQLREHDAIFLLKVRARLGRRRCRDRDGRRYKGEEGRRELHGREVVLIEVVLDRGFEKRDAKESCRREMKTENH